MKSNIFDDILANKIGYGTYQIRMYIILGFIYLADGSELLALSLLLPVLKNEWNITEGEATLMGTVLFLGVFLGGLSVGVVADKYGRKKTLLYSSFIQFWIGILSAVVSDISLLILTRALFGFMIGFTWPLAPSMISEVTPLTNRGKGLLFGNLLYTFGKVYGCFIAWITLDSLTSGNWRLMLVMCSIPAIAVCYGSWKYLEESPRYYLATGRLEEAVSIMDKMGAINKKEAYCKVTEAEKLSLAEYQESTFDTADVANIKSLFNEKYKHITICLWVMWFSVNFIFYGMIFILPFILSTLDASKDHKGIGGLAGLLITILGEFPSILLCLVIVEHKSLGRRNSATIGFAGGFVLLLLACIIDSDYFVGLMSLARFFLKIGSAMLNPLTAELYPTSYRTAGVGFAVAVGRGGNTIMPVLCMLAFDKALFGPIMLFAVLAIVATVGSYNLPYDTVGRALDQGNGEDEKEKSLLEKESGKYFELEGQTNFKRILA